MSIPNPTVAAQQAPPTPPHVALPLIRNRVERLAVDIAAGPPRRAQVAGLAGAVLDLIDVVEQVALAASR